MTKPWFDHYDEQVAQEIEIPQVPMTALLETAAKERPEGTAVHFFGNKISYTLLYDLVNRFAGALSELGVKKGDRVAIVLPNVPQYPICHWAIMKLGAIIVPTNPLYTERELEYQLRDSGAETVVILDLLFKRLSAVRGNLNLRNIIVTGVKDYLPPLLKMLYPIKEKKEGIKADVAPGPGIYFFVELMKKTKSAPPNVEVSAKDTAMFLYTGGTTGTAKGAVLTHENIVANVHQARTWLWDVEDGREVIMTAIPLFHSYGMTACHHLAVQSKSAMVLVPKFDAKQIMKEINKLKVTIFPGVPTMYIAINNHPDVKKYDLASIRACISGGAALPQEVQAEFERITGGRLVEGYGLSECSPVTHCNPIFGLRKTGSIGAPWPNTDARIVNPEDKAVLKVGEVGELAVRGPQVMQGYWQNEEETKQVLINDWLFTGDMAKMDEDGFFFIVDRKKDMIVSGGLNIYPREIEEVLFEHPKVLEAAAIGIPDEYYGEKIKVFVVLKEGVQASDEEIIGFCEGKLAKFKIPKVVEFRDELPKSLIGKVLRRVLIEGEKTKSGEGAQDGKEK